MIGSRIKLALTTVILTVATGCNENPVSYYELPYGATNFQELGNSWYTFDVNVNGTKRTILYKHYGMNGQTLGFTELKPR
jgi:hypothetical protein